jgi:hypothetical protein
VAGEKPRYRGTDDKAPSDERNPEWERFENTLKKLVKVPKEEVDEERAKREREKRAGNI